MNKAEITILKARHLSLLVAITKIANCNEHDVTKYIKKVDSIAIDAMIKEDELKTLQLRAEFARKGL